MARDDGYIEALRDWQRREADPAVFEHLDTLFPEYMFRRVHPGAADDRWESPLKLDLSQPREKSRRKTVVKRFDMRFREQGEWDSPVRVTDMLGRKYGLSNIHEIYTYVAQRFALDMPRPAGGRSWAEAMSARERRAELLKVMQDYFSWNLRSNERSQGVKEVRRYLEGRGFRGRMDADFCGFGYVLPWPKVMEYLRSHRLRFTDEEIDAACAVRSENGHTSVGRDHVLSIPYLCGGELKGFLFRAVRPDVTPKYRANAGLDRKSSFFNVPDAFGRDASLLVVEGEMDALVATVAGASLPAAAMGGSDISGERRRQVEDALGRGAERFVLCPDLDAKDGVPLRGKRLHAVMRSVHTIKDIALDFDEIYVVNFNAPTDPADYIREHGADSFNALIAKALPWWEYVAMEKRSGL